MEKIAREIEGNPAVEKKLSKRYGTVAQIRRNADSGERMPAKTTFFHPKPRTGMVFRALDPA